MNKSQDTRSEIERLRELQEYNILDTLTEKDYDGITFIASLICNVPVSLISFVDKDRQWFKSHKGTAISETPREYSFCAHTIGVHNTVMVVNDARKDARFSTNPLVTGSPNIVFYAGAPLVSSNGFSLGTVCVLDTQPRELTAGQTEGLQVLANQVMNLLDLRKNAIDLQVAKLQTEIRNKDLEQFAMIVAHDIKSPLTAIVMSNELLAGNYATQLDKDALHLLTVSNRSAAKITGMVDNILAYYKNGTGGQQDTTFDFVEMLDSVTATIVSPKQYRVAYRHLAGTLYMNRTQLEQIFFNLINNSIRYNDKQVAKITIRFREDTDAYHFTVSDNGMGIPTEKQDKIFNLFTTAATSDVFGIKGHGIGLPSVKKIIDNYQGTITVASEVGMGTVISFTIKKPSQQTTPP